MLTGAGFRVVCMDNMGHGGSDVPRVPPASIENYTLKYHSDVIVELARHLGCNRITLGGHDWVSHYDPMLGELGIEHDIIVGRFHCLQACSLASRVCHPALQCLHTIPTASEVLYFH